MKDMNPLRHWCVLATRMTLLLLFTLIITACPTETLTVQSVQNTRILTQPPQEDGSDEPIVGSAPAPAANLDDYQVLLEADKKMKATCEGYNNATERVEKSVIFGTTASGVGLSFNF